MGSAKGVDEDDEPFNENPNYNYAFSVADKEEQVFQAHKQKLDDNVRIVEYNNSIYTV